MADNKNFSRMTLFAAIGVAIVLMVVAVPFSMTGKEGVPMEEESGFAVAARISPVAHFQMPAAPAAGMEGAEGMAAEGAGAAPRDGATLYKTVCIACHAAGVAGAPKVGDKAAWAPRIAQGIPALIHSVTVGKNAMPPRAGNSSLTDEEIKLAVEYIVAQEQ